MLIFDDPFGTTIRIEKAMNLLREDRTVNPRSKLITCRRLISIGVAGTSFIDKSMGNIIESKRFIIRPRTQKTCKRRLGLWTNQLMLLDFGCFIWINGRVDGYQKEGFFPKEPIQPAQSSLIEIYTQPQSTDVSVQYQTDWTKFLLRHPNSFQKLPK